MGGDQPGGDGARAWALPDHGDPAREVRLLPPTMRSSLIWPILAPFVIVGNWKCKEARQFKTRQKSPSS